MHIFVQICVYHRCAWRWIFLFWLILEMKLRCLLVRDQFDFCHRHIQQIAFNIKMMLKNMTKTLSHQILHVQSIVLSNRKLKNLNVYIMVVWKRINFILNYSNIALPNKRKQNEIELNAKNCVNQTVIWMSLNCLPKLL